MGNTIVCHRLVESEEVLCEEGGRRLRETRKEKENDSNFITTYTCIVCIAVHCIRTIRVMYLNVTKLVVYALHPHSKRSTLMSHTLQCVCIVIIIII